MWVSLLHCRAIKIAMWKPLEMWFIDWIFSVFVSRQNRTGLTCIFLTVWLTQMTSHPSTPSLQPLRLWKAVHGLGGLYGKSAILTVKTMSAFTSWWTGHLWVSSIPHQIKRSCSGQTRMQGKLLMVLGTRQRWAWKKILQNYCLIVGRSVLSQQVRRATLAEVNIFYHWNHQLMSLLVWWAQPGRSLSASSQCPMERDADWLDQWASLVGLTSGLFFWEFIHLFLLNELFTSTRFSVIPDVNCSLCNLLRHAFFFITVSILFLLLFGCGFFWFCF